MKNLDPSLLMWDMRRNLLTAILPDRRCIVAFHYPEQGAGRNRWWLVINGDDVDLCSVDPGFDVDLHVVTSLRSMTAIWMGLTSLQAEVAAGTTELTGDKAIAATMQDWLGLSPFAKEKNRRAG